MVDSIKTFENSLRDYLMGVGSDSYDDFEKRKYKYNNLKFYIAPDKVHVPHFYVSVNLSSLLIILEPLKIANGSLGNDDILILRWASRPNILGELKKYYTCMSHSQNQINQEVVIGGFIVNEKVKTKEELEQEISETIDYITGSGVQNIRGHKGKENEQNS